MGRARWEEKVLGEAFGDEWADYMKKTRFIIPYIW
jgi:protein-S-isoprenylcysteine O-methyltransferase Ste14